MTITFTQLRDADMARDKEWDSKADLGLPFATTEFAGEVGELCEVALLLAAMSGKLCNSLKKVMREQYGLKGSRVTFDQVEREFGDVQITLDLLAMKAGVNLNDATRRAFNEKSEQMGFKTRL